MARPPKGITLHRAVDQKIERGTIGIITLVCATNSDILVAGMSAARVFQLNDTELGLSIVAADKWLNPVVSTFDEDESLSEEYGFDNTSNNSIISIVESSSTNREAVETEQQATEKEVEAYDSLADDEELNYADVIKSSEVYERELIERNISQLTADIAANPDDTNGSNSAREQSLAANKVRLARLDSAVEDEKIAGKSASARSRAKKQSTES